jgi:hypothetical protein
VARLHHLANCIPSHSAVLVRAPSSSGLHLTLALCVSLRGRLPPGLSAGPKHHFERSLHTRTLCDHSDKTIRECYARTEALQGKGTISIDEIRMLLSYVYGGLPPEREVGLLTRHCDLQQRGPQLPGRGAESGILLRVSLDLLIEAVEIVRKQLEENLQFKEIAGVKQVAGEFQSRAHMAEHAHKHARSKFNPSGQHGQHRGGAQQQRGAARAAPAVTCFDQS